MAQRWNHITEKYSIYEAKVPRKKKGKIFYEMKIGACLTHHLPQREYQQRAIYFEWLESSDCIYEISDREIALQKQYGYKVDQVPYYKMVERWTKNRMFSLEQELELMNKAMSGKWTLKRLSEMYGISKTGIIRMKHRYNLI